jgi:GAF domain-containing protein
LQRRLIALQSLATISQAISGVTDLDDLFDSIHEQITKVVGDVDLAIALYDPKTDMISIPYAQEADQKIALEPFPLGQGLTSILIRTQQPLLLVEDTERRARELGAKITGAPAKSWLGVPLIVSGEVLGAILLQDIEHEQRFNEDDLRLITTLASQVAITIRNARLLQESNLRAERERIVSDITSKIWSSPNVDSIARNALQELSRSLQVSEGSIFLTNADNSEILRRQLGIREN